MAGRRAAQTAALVALLSTLPEDQLKEVIGGLAVKGLVTTDAPSTDRYKRRCGICGEFYPKCRSRWKDDHDFEPPAPRATEETRRP